MAPNRECRQQLKSRLERLQNFVIPAYAVAVFLPITISWAVLIVAMANWVLLIFVRAMPVHLKLAGVKPEQFWRKLRTADYMGRVVRAPLAVPLLTFMFMTFLSGSVNGGIKEGFESLFSLRALMIYPVAYEAFSSSPGLLKRTLGTLLTAGAVAGLWGAIQQLFSFHPFQTYQYLQASGFMGKPMAYAGQMQILASLALAMGILGGYRHLPAWLARKEVFIIVVLFNAAGVFFASERSAWLGIFTAILCMSYLVSGKVFVRVCLSLCVVFAACWFTVPVVKKRIMPLLTNIQSDVSVQARFKVWAAAVDVWKSHPWLGAGPRNFPHLDIPEAVVPGESTYLVHAHSNYLHIMATMGILGFASFMYLQLSMLYLAFGKLQSTRQKEVSNGEREGLIENSSKLMPSLALGCFGSIVSLAVSGFFEYNFGTGHVRLLSWFVLALLGSMKSSRDVLTESKEIDTTR